MVVVSFVHAKIGVEAAKLGIDVFKCAQSKSQNRPLREHVKRIAINAQPKIAAEFGAVIRQR